jgi:hypothetical protein
MLLCGWLRLLHLPRQAGGQGAGQQSATALHVTSGECWQLSLEISECLQLALCIGAFLDKLVDKVLGSSVLRRFMSPAVSAQFLSGRQVDADLRQLVLATGAVGSVA